MENSLPNTNNFQQGGADLKEIYKERNMVGGRIKKSLSEFLYNDKVKTKRKNNYIHKLVSRKR